MQFWFPIRLNVVKIWYLPLSLVRGYLFLWNSISFHDFTIGPFFCLPIWTHFFVYARLRCTEANNNISKSIYLKKIKWESKKVLTATWNFFSFFMKIQFSKLSEGKTLSSTSWIINLINWNRPMFRISDQKSNIKFLSITDKELVKRSWRHRRSEVWVEWRPKCLTKYFAKRRHVLKYSRKLMSGFSGNYIKACNEIEFSRDTSIPEYDNYFFLIWNFSICKKHLLLR